VFPILEGGVAAREQERGRKRGGERERERERERKKKDVFSKREKKRK
jgi:hypothetical protein